MMAFNNPSTLRGLRIAVLKVVSWSNSMEKQVKFLDNQREENKVLRKKILNLSMENQRLREVMMENIRLRRLLKFRKESQYKFIAANVIGFGQEKTVRSIILDVGSADSVRENYPVVTDRGLVGKILIAEPKQSIAQILMDHNTLVSARLQQSREIGVIGWSGNLWLDLDYIPKDVDVEPGEVVLTSGFSRIYPEGIKIGIVGEIEENQYELFKEIRVKPAVNFNSLEEVFVLLTPDSLKLEMTNRE